jgi:hypothetical protein
VSDEIRPLSPITPADRLRAELAVARKTLALAVNTIEGLADQQAMPDDWYVADLERIKKEAAR